MDTKLNILELLEKATGLSGWSDNTVMPSSNEVIDLPDFFEDLKTSDVFAILPNIDMQKHLELYEEDPGLYSWTPYTNGDYDVAVLYYDMEVPLLVAGDKSKV